MKFYTGNIVKKVRNLKGRGVNTSKIAKKFNINRDTILRWCLDIPSDNLYHLKSLKIKKELKQRGKKSLDKISINKENAKMFAALLYWCEGYKYPGCNYIGFVNSDFNLVKTFVKLFRMGFDIKEEKFRVQLQLHTTHDKKKMISFWSNLLGISEKSFQKSTITKPSNKMKRKDYKGTCAVRYYDFKIYNEIIGIYEGFIDKVLSFKNKGN